MHSPSSSSPKKTLMALRLLALSAPGGRMSLIEASRLVQQVIPVDNALILWQDEQCNIVDVYQILDVPLFLVQDYLENFMHTTGRDGEEAAGFTLKQLQMSGKRVATASDTRDHHQFLHSPFYARFIRQLQGFWAAGLPLRAIEGKPIAVASFGRALNCPDFNRKEVTFLEQAQPWLEHLARKEGKVGTETACIGGRESASLLIDAAGKVLSASAFALTLLHQAADSPLSDRISLQRTVQGDVSILLRRFSNSITAAMNTLSALPPSLVVNNRWGRFHLLAYVLNPLERGLPMQISLHVERKVPLSLGLIRLPNFLNLSSREREVCLHILAGLGRTEIAQAMHVKPSTIIYFTRQLYQRLNVNRQSELLPALMADAESG